MGGGRDLPAEQGGADGGVEDAGGGDFYDRVYDADRPELFFKATPHRVVGPGEPVRIRGDSKWNVPEPELALLVSPRGEIVGYTIGNDMSSRDIEGENPLYLPQAKVYDGCCALGPCVLLGAAEPLPQRHDDRAGDPPRRRGRRSRATTSLAQMKREVRRAGRAGSSATTASPTAAILLTGTGIVPPDAFTLQSGDEVRITIEPIGTLRNLVA